MIISSRIGVLLSVLLLLFLLSHPFFVFRPLAQNVKMFL